MYQQHADLIIYDENWHQSDYISNGPAAWPTTMPGLAKRTAMSRLGTLGCRNMLWVTLSQLGWCWMDYDGWIMMDFKKMSALNVLNSPSVIELYRMSLSLHDLVQAWFSPWRNMVAGWQQFARQPSTSGICVSDLSSCCPSPFPLNFWGASGLQ